MTRIAVVGNLANVGYELVRAVAELGEDIKLVAPRNRLDAWRRVVTDMPPEQDEHLHVVRPGPHWSPAVAATLRKYDVVLSVCLAGTPVLPLLGRPYVSYATGSDLYELAVGAPIYPRSHAVLARRTFRKAHTVLLSLDNAQIAAAERLGLRRLAACRHFVDLPYWQATPSVAGTTEGIVVLSVSHLIWRPQFPGQPLLKRNDILLEGFAEFIASGGHGRLVMLRRGADADQLDPLLQRLRITNAVEVIEGGVARDQLCALFAGAHVIGDQFSPEGGLGVTAIEALAAGRPVLASRCEPALTLAYGDDPPPVRWADNPDEVAAQLHALTDAAVLRQSSVEGATWAQRQHDRARLAEWYRDVLLEAANG